jgi:2-oxoglutarate dehydrogenase E2 component (dihydrolipoamide succinyltransferase)
MSEPVQICLPKLGESILTATVVQWLKGEGDLIALDEPLLEVATDNVNSEIPSPVAGRLTKILVGADAQVEIGAPLALIATGGAASLSVDALKVADTHSCGPESASEGFLSPAVLRLVREHAIPLKELDRIRGTGQGGRITKRDIESYVVAKGTCVVQTAAATAERIPLSPMRKAIAENMASSFYKAPHAYVLTEIDLTNLLASVDKEREEFLQRHGVKLTITSHFIQAIAAMVRAYPLVNATFEEEALVVKQMVNIGVAVAVDNGLIVPVIRNCQGRALSCIAKALADLSARARTRSLKPDEVNEGSITLTNFGMSGALMGLPIIRYPEVVIVGIGAIQKKLVVRPDDSLAIRKMVHATLSFDHRAIDGMYAGAALQAFKASLESSVC